MKPIPYLAGHPAPAGAPAFTRELAADGIAILTFDLPGSPANLWSESTLRQFVWHLEQIEHNPAIRGLILRSAKPGIFIAGADLKALRHLCPARMEQLIWLGQATFDRLARLRMPKVALIHGACAGGGYEMALACDWRIATDDPATKIGLPETQLGLLPGWGGTVRLPRLLGLRRALDVILSGKLYGAKAAFKKGLVTHLAPPEAAPALAHQLALGSRFSFPFHADHLPGVAHLIARLARRSVLAQTRGLYPAPLRAIDVALRSLHLPTDAALALERDAIVHLTQSAEAGHLIDLFFQRETANKQRPATGHALPLHSAVVVGAGVMGSGIAQTLLSRGIATLLTDVSPTALARGISNIHRLTQHAVKARVFTPKQARETLDRLSTAHTPVPLGRHHLVIEAATENLDLKKKIFADLATRCGPDTILATNTSALSVANLAASVPHPERVIGLHFFNPAHKMPLVEVITLPETHPDVLATAVAFVQSLGKTPIVVQDRPGFVVNRILMPYLMEAVRLHDTGIPAADIDEAMLAFGMPMGPLRLLDEIGLDVAQHVADTLSTAFPGRFTASNTLREKIAAGHLGKKTGRGFYPHPSKHRRPRLQLFHADIQRQLTDLITAEAQRCLDENVAASAADINLAMILGTGYPPATGGPLKVAQAAGTLPSQATEPIAPHPLAPSFH
jgi:3-hydroxyacyl-CoA dehydrogenase / enoyl-CoA hydratase / 3-hydroxybutyryl-CoA epimerase